MNCQDMFYSNDYGDYLFDRFSVRGQELLAPASCVTNVNEAFAVIQAPRDERDTEEFLNFQNLPRLFGLLDTGYLEASGVLKVQRDERLDLFGQGVILGVVDTGIDYRHPAFRNEDDTTRIGVLWDQSIPGENPDARFPYGTIYNKDQINAALREEDPYLIVPSRDEIGHGTLLCGIAAGGIEEEADFQGVAPLCELAVVKLKEAKAYLKDFWLVKKNVPAYQETDIFLAVQFLLDYAYEVKKPVVILLGCGTNTGNHGESDYLKNYLNNICTFSGKSVVLPAGNEGSLGHHFRGNGLDNTEYQDVEIQVGEEEQGFLAELWAEAPDVYSVGFLTPGGEYTQKIPVSITEEGIETGFILDQTEITVFYERVERTTGNMLIWMRIKNPTAGVWKIRIFKERVLSGRYDIWLPIEPFLTSDTYFLRPDPDTTVCEPGNAGNPVTVTAYDHRENTLFFQAGRGYTRDNRVKPDVAAPGVDIMGPAGNLRYRTATGTSMAAAVAAGCAVLLFSYRGYYTGLQIKNLLIRGAARKNIAYPNREWGYGEVNVYESITGLGSRLS